MTTPDPNLPDPTPLPVPPPLDYLARSEASWELLSEKCQHCQSETVVISRNQDGHPQAVEVHHQLGCPTLSK